MLLSTDWKLVKRTLKEGKGVNQAIVQLSNPGARHLTTSYSKATGRGMGWAELTSLSAKDAFTPLHLYIANSCQAKAKVHGC